MSDHGLNLEQHCRNILSPPNGRVGALQLAVSCRLLNSKISVCRMFLSAPSYRIQTPGLKTSVFIGLPAGMEMVCSPNTVKQLQHWCKVFILFFSLQRATSISCRTTPKSPTLGGESFPLLLGGARKQVRNTKSSPHASCFQCRGVSH